MKIDLPVRVLFGAAALALACCHGDTYTVVRENAYGLDVVTASGASCFRTAPACWGPQWRWFGLTGEVEIADGRRIERGTAVVNGTGVGLDVAMTSWSTGPRSFAQRVVVRAHADTALTMVALELTPAAEVFRAGTVRLLGPAGEVSETAVPIQRGALAGVAREIQFAASEGPVLVWRLEPPRPVSAEHGRLRLQWLTGEARGGEDVDTTLTCELDAPARFIVDPEDALDRTDTSGWFPYATGGPGVPVDLSFLNRDDDGNYVPAGGHGFLRVDGDRFVFEDGTPGRFWGVNLTAGAALGGRERAAQLAEDLARLGVNAVRLHHLDSWHTPIVDYDHADGTTQHLDEAAMANLDHTMHELRRRGIYIIPDPWVQRCFTEADGVDDYGAVGKRGNFNLHPYVYFDDRMQDLIKMFWTRFWNHVNPHTGLAYKDDPAIILTELINEGLMQRGGNHVRAPAYRRRFLELYERWAAEHDVTSVGERIIHENYGRDNLRFYVHVCRRFYRGMHAHLRSIGLRIPINATNWQMWAWEMLPQLEGDFMDAHHYYGGDRIGPGSALGGLWLEHRPGIPGPPFGRLGAMSVLNMPLYSSECGNNPPKTYRSAYMLGLAAVACLQDWDAVTGYAYSQSPSPRDVLSPFEWESDPMMVASMAAGALVFRRRDVSPAHELVAITFPGDELWQLRWQDDGRGQLSNTPGLNAMLETHRVRVVLGETVPETVRPDHHLTNVECIEYDHGGSTELLSDTHELWRDWDRGAGCIDTPCTQAAYGRLGESDVWTTRDCEFRMETPYAVVCLSSLDDAPLTEAKRILVTAAARAENSDQAANFARTRIVRKGHAPVIAEPVVGEIRLRTSVEALRLVPLQADGREGAPLGVPLSGGTAHVRLAADSQTVFYRLESP